MREPLVIDKNILLAVLLAVLLHGFLLLLWASLWGLHFPKPPGKANERELLVIVDNVPFIKEEIPVLVKKQKQTEKQVFARTSEEQEKKPNTETRFIGERDTQAASEEASSDDDNPQEPTQKGIDPLHPDHLETVNSQYQDQSKEQIQNAKKETKQKEEKIPEHKSAPKEHPEENLLEKKLVSPPEPRKKVQDVKNNTNQSKQKKTSPRNKRAFREHTRKTQIKGSISRRGKSSLNVKKTALGQYQAKISRAIEVQWRRSCIEYRDLIVPGLISFSFSVDKNGNVTEITPYNALQGNIPQESFTFRAIQNANIPPMPNELKVESLDLIFDFYF